MYKYIYGAGCKGISKNKRKIPSSWLYLVFSTGIYLFYLLRF